MSFAPGGYACEKIFSTPFPVQVPIGTSLLTGASSILTSTSFESVGYVSSDRTTSGSWKTFRSYSTVTYGSANADPISVAWHESELSLFPSEYAASVAKQIGLEMNFGSSSSNIQTETSTPIPAPVALSTGAKVGTIVGAVLGATVIAALAYACLVRRRKRKNTSTGPAAETQTAELENQDEELAGWKWHLRGKWRNEAEAVDRHQELDSRTINVIAGPPVELDASDAHGKDS